MALKSNKHGGDFDKDVEEKIRQAEERVIAALQYAGEMFVKECREQAGDHSQGFYEDKTGNLRNSIGYYVFAYGDLVASDGGPTSEKNLGLISPYVLPKAFQLIGIAGMNYASYVEAKGYNVISMQADACVVRIEEYMKDVRQFLNG